MLHLADVDIAYGRNHAVRQLSLEVKEGEFVGLVGHNGAGKTSTLMAVAGAIRPRAGTITLNNERIDRLSPDQILKRGVALVPEGRRIFARLSVGENLRIGATRRSDHVQVKREIAVLCERFPVLGRSWEKSGAHLSGGEQQLLAIARALLSKPTLLVLDEPTLGLAPLMVDQIFEILEQLHRDGTTILLVEQNAARTVQTADRSYVMRSGGRIEMNGTSEQLAAQGDFATAYLGMSPKALA